jgi:hypothetical protein
LISKDAMKARYQSLVADVARAIDDADPIGLLEGGAPADEYGPEIGTIVPRVVNAQSVEEVTTVLHEEFLRWFGDDIAGTRHGGRADAVELPQPTGGAVPTDAVLVHHSKTRLVRRSPMRSSTFTFTDPHRIHRHSHDTARW